jgi:hypothetical protein
VEGLAHRKAKYNKEGLSEGVKEALGALWENGNKEGSTHDTPSSALSKLRTNGSLTPISLPLIEKIKTHFSQLTSKHKRQTQAGYVAPACKQLDPVAEEEDEGGDEEAEEEEEGEEEEVAEGGEEIDNEMDGGPFDSDEDDDDRTSPPELPSGYQRITRQQAAALVEDPVDLEQLARGMNSSQW